MCLEEREIKGLLCLLIGMEKGRRGNGTQHVSDDSVCVFVLEADTYLCTVMD